VIAPLVRSWLYVPGHRPDVAAKAVAGEADAVVIDLEDAVPADRKADARAGAFQTLAEGPAKPVWVRVNPFSSDLTADDVRAVAHPALSGVRLAKTESADEVTELAELLSRAGCEPAVQCLIESALGLERAFELASHPAVVGIGLGEADLAADLGASDDLGLLYARSRCVAAARAAGLAPPPQSVWTDVGDLDGLRESTRQGRSLGFFGRSAVHPRQLPVIHDAMRPSAGEVEHARALVEALRHAEERGATAVVLPDGRFADPAVVERARRILALAECHPERVGP